METNEKLKIRVFECNPLAVNTYVISDQTGDAVIVDPGMVAEDEKAGVKKYITDNNLTIKYIIATHPHIDHVLGCGWSVKEFGAPLLMHEDGMPVYEKAVAYGVAFGLDCERDDFPEPDRYILGGDEIAFGNEKLKVLETPGHCAGSVSLYHPDDGIVFVGDLVFQNGVGRTDLPTGNALQLSNSIRNIIFQLPETTIIYPGHGLKTTVRYEKY